MMVGKRRKEGRVTLETMAVVVVVVAKETAVAAVTLVVVVVVVVVHHSSPAHRLLTLDLHLPLQLPLPPLPPHWTYTWGSRGWNALGHV